MTEIRHHTVYRSGGGLISGTREDAGGGSLPKKRVPRHAHRNTRRRSAEFGMARHERQRQGRRTKLLHHSSTLETSTASPSVSGWVGALIGFRHAGQAAVRICRGREGTT